VSLFTIREVEKGDRDWIRRWLVFQWGAEIVISHDTVYHPADLLGFIAIDPVNSEPIGLITYVFSGNECEIVTLDSLREGNGIGSALIDHVILHARNIACDRVFLVVTNDNIYSLGFYQKRGFRLVKINSGAADRARKQKPQIPAVGYFSIPIHDEIELEYRLNPQ